MIDVIKVIILFVSLIAFLFVFFCSESEQQKNTREFSKRYLEKSLKELKKDVDK